MGIYYWYKKHSCSLFLIESLKFLFIIWYGNLSNINGTYQNYSRLAVERTNKGQNHCLKPILVLISEVFINWQSIALKISKNTPITNDWFGLQV